MNAADIRAKYPDPITIFHADRRPGYCVGGALCMAIGRPDRFPTPRDLAATLSNTNPNLAGQEGTAYWFAVRITQNNDRGEIEEAWGWLDRALKFVGSESEWVEMIKQNDTEETA